MVFKADMHIHSVLSPCGDIEMSPSAIVAKAKEKGLDIIGLTDHNSTLNADVTRRLGEKVGLHVLMGAEVTTKEEVHCLCFMPTVEKLAEFQAFLDSRVIFFENDVDRFGYQLVVDEDENVLDQVPHLLINALDLPMMELYPEITWAPPGNHVGPTRKSRGPHGEITWAPPGNHVGPTGKSRGPHPEITRAPPGNHVATPATAMSTATTSTATATPTT